MSNPVSLAKEQLRSAVDAAIAALISEGALPEGDLRDYNIEVPADRKNGDFSVNAAMVNAKVFRMAPRKSAELIAGKLSLDGTYFDRAEVAGPGFLNFYLSGRYYADILLNIHDEGDHYGRSNYGEGKKVLVEFVSANPTGPMHMGNARGGALGDCLAAVLDWAGYSVSREFYINDYGNQIEKFATSLDVRYQQHFLGEDAVELPEDAYHGADIRELAEAFIAETGEQYKDADPKERKKALVEFSLPRNIQNMHEAMEKYRIYYDTWFYESSIHKDGEVRETIEALTDKGLTYEKDGALWYKNTEVQTKRLLAEGKTQDYIDKQDLKDDVLIRSNGTPTYFAADIAYHRNKLVLRGYDKAIDVWGADHHGHVARMQGALDALGIGGDKLDVVLMQLVKLTRNGETVRMSKRTGNAITLTDLLDEIPIDAARFLFNTREAGSEMEFDLGLAVEQTSQNPVYYCQYAHARICSILKKMAAEGKNPEECTAEELGLLTDPTELELIRHLSILPDEIVTAAETYDPARITRYCVELATLFHKFYNACRVDVDDPSLSKARLYLCMCVKNVLKNVLTMLKITVPDHM
ncbi:MAG: arginine--tRNA ligase [Acutalibacteraceae bacterium]|nr:arginine--tRNA ligase [Acutalibacteraceae bacterium]